MTRDNDTRWGIVPLLALGAACWLAGAAAFVAAIEILRIVLRALL